MKHHTCTELAKKAGPRLRDLAIAPAGGITQPRTNLVGHFCTLMIRIHFASSCRRCSNLSHSFSAQQGTFSCWLIAGRKVTRP